MCLHARCPHVHDRVPVHVCVSVSVCVRVHSVLMLMKINVKHET
jgi:hypothetical protein